MKETLNEILQRMLSTVDAGVEFLSKEIPDVINQLLLWNMVEHLIYFIVGVAILVLTFIGVKFMFILMDEDSEAVILSVPLLGTAAAGITLVFYNIKWLKIIIAPKVYLIEYAASLIK